MKKLFKQSQTDIVVHINEELNIEQRSQLSTNLSHLNGIQSAKIQERCPHLMIVGYDSDQTKPLAVLAGIQNTGLHAQLVSWL